MMTRRDFLSCGSALGLLVTLAPGAATAAPDAELWPRWEAHDPESTTTVDHSIWAMFLEHYVERGRDGITRIDYQAAMAAKAGLEAYLRELSAVEVSQLNRAEQFAYWANLYNALTVATVLNHYPVDTIRDIDISNGLFANGPWGADLVEIEGVSLTLDDIEHRILRPIWTDNRVHYAVNCAALGCPSLLPEPFDAARLEEQLTAAAHDFVNHPRGAKVEDGQLHVSSLYDWFQSDFGGSEIGVIRHLQKFAKPPLAQQLEGIEEIAGDDYDWSLNDLRPANGT